MTPFDFPTRESAAPEAHPLLEGPAKQLGFVPNLLPGLAMKTTASHANHLLGTPIDAQSAARRWHA